MSLDLAKVYRRGGVVLQQAIETSGSRINVSRDADLAGGVTVDKATLAVTDSTPATAVMVNEPALVTAAGTASVDVGPGRTAARPAYRFLLRATAKPVQKGDEIRFTRSPEPQLLPAVLEVTEYTAHPSGLFHDFTAVVR